jgi:hypothetical protein
MTRGDSTQSCAMLCRQGGNAENLDIARGNLRVFFYRGVLQNSLTLQGGISLLTLFSIMFVIYFLTL